MTSSTSRVAVILFPGTNSEVETVRALRRVGLEAEVVRWNETDRVAAFDAYVLPGGFSFEDRGRSGMVAGFEPIMERIRQEVASGKMVVGICNGCQTLVDSGVLTGPGGERLAMAWNVRRRDGRTFGRWVSRTPWLKMSGMMEEEMGETVFKAPVAHGEGRYACLDADVFDRMDAAGQVILKYCDADGVVSDQYPTTPNGSPKAIAGICDSTGRVVGWMPHPERMFPREGYEEADKVFEWMMRKLKSKNEKVKMKAIRVDGNQVNKAVFDPEPELDIEILTELKITDNEAWTIEQVARRVVSDDIRLRKQVWWGIVRREMREERRENLAVDLIQTGELCNVNKMGVEVREKVKNKNEKIKKGKKVGKNEYRFLILEREDTVGQMKTKVFEEHHANIGVGTVMRGLLWTVRGVDEAKALEMVKAGILHNSQSMRIVKI